MLLAVGGAAVAAEAAQVSVPAAQDTTVFGRKRGDPGHLGSLRVSEREAALLRFDLSSIPPTAVVSRAKLNAMILARRASNGGVALGAHAVLGPWDETAATTLSPPAINSEVLSMNSAQGARFGDHIEWDVTRLAASWVRDPSTNFGVALRGLAKKIQLSSREGLATPLLEVEYRAAGEDDGRAHQPGPTGPTGPEGLVGPIGPTGLAGLVGPTGLPGLIGPTGLPGLNGPTGLPGVTGPIGLPGVTGPIGPAGLTGPTGITGPTGLIGPTGLTGLTGATGPATASTSVSGMTATSTLCALNPCTDYLSILGVQAPSVVESSLASRWIAPSSLHVTALACAVAAAPGVGSTRTFTLMVGGAPNANVACPIAGSATECSVQPVAPQAVSSGALLDVRNAVSGAAAAASHASCTLFYTVDSL